MIELLGVGMRGPDGDWLFRRVCARIESPSLVVVVGGSRQGREALLDIVAGQRIAAEGRAWVDRIPVMADTRRRVRGRVADVRAQLARPRWSLSRLLRGGAGLGPLDASASVRELVSSAVTRCRTHLLLRDLDLVLTPRDLGGLGLHLRSAAYATRSSILIGLADATPLREVADRIIGLDDVRSGTVSRELQFVG